MFINSKQNVIHMIQMSFKNCVYKNLVLQNSIVIKKTWSKSNFAFGNKSLLCPFNDIVVWNNVFSWVIMCCWALIMHKTIVQYPSDRQLWQHSRHLHKQPLIMFRGTLREWAEETEDRFSQVLQWNTIALLVKQCQTWQQ